MNDLNYDVESVEGSQYTHAGINEAIGSPGESIITPALVEFFQRCFEE
ncbi:MAG: hypothetical protein WBA16_09855 [Nonlabens sp.]